jgi:UDP-2,4-diacetamido-2,4,6-trideoxy-beta-L-altropyranose hydrolase
MKRDLFIRTDGSAQIGLGHVVRSMSLASYLRDLYNITFVFRQIPQKLQDEIESGGFTLKQIESEDAFLSQLSPGHIAVLDGYGFDSDYQKRIKEKGPLLVCIDDLHDQFFYADLVINQAPGITPEDYSAKSTTQFALGPDYTLLRLPFIRAASSQQHSKSKSIKNLLICFGGSDSPNLTQRSLKVARDFNPFEKIFIITGSAYLHENQLIREIEDDERVEYHRSLNGSEMAELFLRSDVAIIPASGILFEALATGSVAISGMYADNQKEVYSGFKALHAIVDAGRFEEAEIRNALNQDWSSVEQPVIIDGKSPERLRSAFFRLQEEFVNQN